MPRVKRAPVVEDDETNDNLDQPTETATLADEPSIEDDGRFLHRLAKELGYKEDFEGSPDKRLEVHQYLERFPRVFEETKSRSTRAARAAAEAIEDERRRIREESIQQVRQAADPEVRVQAAQRLAEVSGPPPETQEWLTRNPWFHTDPDAQALAQRRVIEAAKRGLTIPAQLQEAEEAVRKRFPEYFPGEAVSGQPEQRLSDVRRSAANPPQVQQGSRVGTPQVKEKGYADIPRVNRREFEFHLLKKFMSRGMTQAQAETQYAKSYWKEVSE